MGSPTQIGQLVKEQRVGQADLVTSRRHGLAHLLGNEKPGEAGILKASRTLLQSFASFLGSVASPPRKGWQCLPSQPELVIIVFGGLLLWSSAIPSYFAKGTLFTEHLWCPSLWAGGGLVHLTFQQSDAAIP